MVNTDREGREEGTAPLSTWLTAVNWMSSVFVSIARPHQGKSAENVVSFNAKKAKRANAP